MVDDDLFFCSTLLWKIEVENPKLSFVGSSKPRSMQFYLDKVKGEFDTFQLVKSKDYNFFFFLSR